MYNNKVVICGVDTSKLPLLKEAQKIALIKEAQSGNTSAREELISGNLRLVLSVIQRFTGRGENLDDLFQVGCIGLIKAIDNFDTTLLVKFSTYAVPMICECRNFRKEVSTMTRKQALHKAIEVLSKSSKYKEEIRLLQELSEELPLIHWSDSSIRDTVEQFILDNGRVPTVTDFKRKGMPPHPVIKQKYKITLSEWLDQNYPTVKPTFEELKAKYTDSFIADYIKIKPKSQEEFNRNKGPETKGWQTVAHYHNMTSWRNLLKVLDLPLYFDMRRDHVPVKMKVTIYNDYDFRD